MFTEAQSVSTNLEYLPTHLMMTPIAFTVTILDNEATSVEDINQEILNIPSLLTVQEIVEFNTVGMLISVFCMHSYIIP